MPGVEGSYATTFDSVGELRQAACQTEGQTAHAEARCLEFSDLHDAKALCRLGQVRDFH